MIISESWDAVVKKEYYEPYFLALVKFLENEYTHHKVYPPMNDLFSAFRMTNYENVKVVIIGQDPYHEFGQAHGLCFSVPSGVMIPPSLQNIFIELKNDLNIPISRNGDLTKWAKQGVLLLNTVLTVREGSPNSHQNMGWETFTDYILRLINQKETPVVYILWGKHAMKKAQLITNPNHIIVSGPHPSPLSVYRGFFGGKYFSRCNQFLNSNGLKPIDWNLNH
ncbi:MAG: uracil-DNA glycosylase [Bacilli bacterium]|jgi:uracil-DNA glycosylase|nr:uracil-DNA glycosylase [Bacilli bacterium]